MINKLCVNVLSGPSGGKSTTAASLFVKLKKRHVNCEIVTEVAKDLVYENNTRALSSQLYVFGQQLYKLQNAYDSTDVVITDSPILLSAIYNQHTSKHLMDLVLEQHRKFNNMNVFVRRDTSYPHSMSGRIHSLTESISIDNQIINLLESQNIPFVYLDETGEDTLVSVISEEVNAKDNIIRQERLESRPVAI
jgi:nicotinamide riboside kinase